MSVRKAAHRETTAEMDVDEALEIGVVPLVVELMVEGAQAMGLQQHQPVRWNQLNGC